MHIKRLAFRNFLCFRGDHELVLGPGAYAVVARREGDAESSNWAGKCLTGDTLVYHPDAGPITIADFCRGKYQKVLGYTAGKIAPVEVVAHACLGKKRTVSVALRDGSTQAYGEAHPILTSRGWVRAGALVAGDHVAKADRLPMSGNWELGGAEASLVACLLGDGVLDGKGLKLCAVREDKRAHFALLLRKVFPDHRVSMLEGLVTLVAGKSRKHRDSGVSAFKRWVAKVGLCRGIAAHKRAPGSLMRACEWSVRAALAGFWLTDGYVSSKSAEVSYTTASLGLAHDVRYLLLRLGLQSRIGKKSIDGRDYHTLRLTLASVRKFSEIVEVPGEKGALLKQLVRRESVSFRKPNVDVLPYEVWSTHPLDTLARTPAGKLRSITAWRVDRRGMSREVFESFGGPQKVSRAEVCWERVVSVEPGGEQVCWDIEVASPERAYVAGVQHAVVHNSALLEAVRFALTGWHRHRTEDGWITAGEDVGCVELELSTGEIIVRDRARGKVTRAAYTVGAANDLTEDLPGGWVKNTAATDAWVTERVGMAERDMLATCIVGQRQAAGLILAGPDERMATVGAWLRLGPLQEADDRMRALVARASGELAVLGGQLATYTHGIVGGGEQEEHQALVAKAAAALEVARADERAARADLEANDRLAMLQQRAGEYAAVVRSGKGLATQLEAAKRAPPDEAAARMLLAEAVAAHVGAEREAAAKRRVLRGEFDGECPVAGIACPAKDQINRGGAQARQQFDVAAGALQRAARARREAEEAERAAAAAAQAIARLEADLEHLRARARDLQPDAKAAGESPRPRDPEALRRRAEHAAAKVAQLAADEGRLRSEANAAQVAQREAERLQGSIQASKARLATAQAAQAVFGKRGAQRRVAEAVLPGIEAVANAILADCGIALQVEVRWGYEGQGLAAACDACGEAFPKSAKVKACPRCGAERGANTIQRLEFVPSDRSGAADDLAGLALRLAAGAWLRGERGSPWAAALLDEPASQMDRANRRAFMKKLPAMLRASGYDQGLVITHHADDADTLPHKIEVVAGKGGSTVRVVA